MQAAQRILYAISPERIGQELVICAGMPVEIPEMGWGSKVSMGFITPDP
ncbi:hypothetical protein AAKU67_004528, partial [Oxalobacteraceae bacterium GrIS 2.11]